MKLALLFFFTFWASVDFSHASPKLCPNTVTEGLTTNRFQDRNAQEYIQAEQQLFEQRNHGLALARLEALLSTGNLNDYEKQAVLRLIAAAYIQNDQPADAARFMDQALRIGADRSIHRQLMAYATTIQLYRYTKDLTGEERTIQLWSSCGGNVNELKERLSECGNDFSKLCLDLTSRRK